MATETEKTIDTLFTQNAEQPVHWQSTDEAIPTPPALSADQLDARLDRSLDLIAEATSAASGLHSIDHYDVSIVVPVYNERNTLPQVLRRIDDVMPPATEVIVVDDASTDGTADWLLGLDARPNRSIIRRRRNHGKGSALRLGIRHSRGRVVAVQDADLEYDPVDLLRGIWPILEGRADVVYGSRYLTPDNDTVFWHRLGNWCLTQFSNVCTGLRLSDMETCHKAFRGDLIRSIPLEEARFGFEPEITAKIAARKARLLEVPTHYESRSYREGKKIGWRDGFAAIRCVWKHRRGSCSAASVADRKSR